MKYYNLKVVVLLKQNLENFETYEKIGNLISYGMLKDKTLKELHEKNTYKNYVFCNLYPVQKDGVYKENNIYFFDLRGIEFQKMMKFKQVLDNLENEYFKIIQINFQTYEQKNIKKLITLTPVVITKLEGGYDIENDLEFVKERILSNTQKKYKNIYETEAKVDFIKNITKTNKKPIKVPYKNKSVLGNKFEIEIKEDPMSQNLAFLVLAVGCGEKNSNLGFGMCMAR